MTEAAPSCGKDGCENPIHVNVNGIQLDYCSTHYLEKMGDEYGHNHDLGTSRGPTGEQLI